MPYHLSVKMLRQVTGFTGRLASNPVKTFLHSCHFQPVTLTGTQLESNCNLSELVSMMKRSHLLIYQHTQQERARIRLSRRRGELANFAEGD